MTEAYMSRKQILLKIYRLIDQQKISDEIVPCSFLLDYY